MKISYVTIPKAAECSRVAGVFGNRLLLQLTVLIENQDKELFVDCNPSVLCKSTGGMEL